MIKKIGCVLILGISLIVSGCFEKKDEETKIKVYNSREYSSRVELGSYISETTFSAVFVSPQAEAGTTTSYYIIEPGKYDINIMGSSWLLGKLVGIRFNKGKKYTITILTNGSADVREE